MSSRLGIIGAIIGKDVREYVRDPFYMLMTLLGLVTYVTIFWFLPNQVDETLEIGVSPPEIANLINSLDVGAGAEEGFEVVGYEEVALLTEDVREGAGIVAGVEFPLAFLPQAALGLSTEVTVYVGASVPDSIEPVISGLVREMSYVIAGNSLPVTVPDLNQVVLGEDRAGDQVSVQERMRPMFAFFVLLLETLALAGLVASEIHGRTASAIVVTPARVSDLLAAKAILGTILAFGQGLLLMAAIGSLSSGFWALLFLLFLGAGLMTGFGLLAGAGGGDFVSIIFLGMVIMFPLAIPTVGILFPGTASWWVQILPSWGLAEGLHRVSTYGDGLTNIIPELTALLGWCLVVFAGGWWVLNRRIVRL